MPISYQNLILIFLQYFWFRYIKYYRRLSVKAQKENNYFGHWTEQSLMFTEAISQYKVVLATYTVHKLIVKNFQDIQLALAN